MGSEVVFRQELAIDRTNPMLMSGGTFPGSECKSDRVADCQIRIPTQSRPDGDHIQPIEDLAAFEDDILFQIARMAVRALECGDQFIELVRDPVERHRDLMHEFRCSGNILERVVAQDTPYAPNQR
ncbi:MAG: hypothetical protein R2848_08890 [Thermomicrobiales bacterium]